MTKIKDKMKEAPKELTTQQQQQHRNNNQHTGAARRVCDVVHTV